MPIRPRKHDGLPIRPTNKMVKLFLYNALVDGGWLIPFKFHCPSGRRCPALRIWSLRDGLNERQPGRGDGTAVLGRLTSLRTEMKLDCNMGADGGRFVGERRLYVQSTQADSHVYSLSAIGSCDCHGSFVIACIPYEITTPPSLSRMVKEAGQLVARNPPHFAPSRPWPPPPPAAAATDERERKRNDDSGVLAIQPESPTETSSVGSPKISSVR